MLLMVQKGSRGEICHAIHWYSKANNRYMKEHDKYNKEFSYLKWWNVNNLNGWAISQKLSVNNFVQFNADFIKSYKWWRKWWEIF